MDSIRLSGQQPTEKGRRPALLCAAAVLLVAVALAAGLHASPSRASSPYMIGINMNTDSWPSASQTVQPCTQVSAGDTFDADIFVTNADHLTAWELRVEFDPDVVSLYSADYEYMLVQSGGALLAAETEKETPGRWFLGAAEPSHPDSGSGILARLHMKALAEGSSAIKITSSPTYFGPRLTGALGAPLGDTTGDAIWDGDLSGATVDVGKTCAPSTPIVTPPPVASSTPAPGVSTPAPTDGSAPDSQASPGASGEPEVQQPGSSPGAAGGPGSITTPGATRAGNPDSAEHPDGGADSGSNSASADSGGGASTLLLALAGVIAVVALVAGAALLLVRRRTDP